MTHPTEEQLHAWLDGETGAPARDETFVAHVERCAHCQRVLEGPRVLGAAVRFWAEDGVPAPAAVDDVADWVFRAAATADATSSAATAPARSSSAATGAGSRSSDGVTAAEAGSDRAASTSSAAVVSLASRRRRWAAVGGVTFALAAAAAAVFAIVRASGGPEHVLPHTPGGGPIASPTGVLHRDAGRTSPAPQVALPGPQTSPAPSTPRDETRGSSVLAIDGESDRTTYSVMEVDDPDENATIAVVWIHDEDELGTENDPSTAVQ
jgi:hypothetical protein